jgi:hypothetical protein
VQVAIKQFLNRVQNVQSDIDRTQRTFTRWS